MWGGARIPMQSLAQYSSSLLSPVSEDLYSVRPQPQRPGDEAMAPWRQGLDAARVALLPPCPEWSHHNQRGGVIMIKAEYSQNYRAVTARPLA